MIVVSIIALVLRFAIEQAIRVNIASNESKAQDNLKTISTAIENYAKDHLGVFPGNLFDLIESNPAYITKEYVSSSTMNGYFYNCTRLDSNGYTCAAAPVKCDITGEKVFVITTGGALSSESCGKNE